MQRREDPYFIPGADDDDVNGVGGSDGDGSGAVQWTRPTADRPWLRSSLPPWHLWGNTQQQSILPLGGGAVPLIATGNQLCKISYKRPDLWNWIFLAKLVSGPDTTGIGQHVTLTVHWDLTIGIGRAAIVIPDFDVFSFNWNDGAAFPVNQQIWSMQTLTPQKAFVAPPPVPPPTAIATNFPAQDIQLSTRCFLAISGLAASPVTVELSGQFSPSTHVRPDWYQDERVPEVQFAGQETAGT